MIQETRPGTEPLDVFEEAMNNVMPVLEVKARRIGGSNYQVPVEVRPDRRTTLGLRWIVSVLPSNAVNIRWTNAWLKKSWTPLTTPVPL